MASPLNAAPKPAFPA